LFAAPISGVVRFHCSLDSSHRPASLSLPVRRASLRRPPGLRLHPRSLRLLPLHKPLIIVYSFNFFSNFPSTYLILSSRRGSSSQIGCTRDSFLSSLHSVLSRRHRPLSLGTAVSTPPLPDFREGTSRMVFHRPPERHPSWILPPLVVPTLSI